MEANLDGLSLEQARARWADDSAELPIGPNVFLALCAAHKVKVGPKLQEGLQQYIESLYLMGNRFGITYRQDIPRPKRGPDFGKLAWTLRDAIDGIVSESELRLRINMIPKPLFRENLRKYLTQTAWLKLRQDLISERGCTCELCGAPIANPSDVDAHEQWDYEPLARPARATVTGIKLACADCHAVVHFGLQFALVQQGKLPASRLEHLEQHFCRVNGVGPRMFSIHVNAATERWAELNEQTSWQLDFGEYSSLLPSQ